MAVKKDIFEKYIRSRESSDLNNHIKKKVYSKNRIFDDPPEQKLRQVVSVENKEPTPLIQQKEEINGPQNRTQTVHKRSINGPRTVHERSTDYLQTVHKTEHKGYTKQNTKNVDLTLNLNFSSFTGLQRKLILVMYRNCKIDGGKVTQRLTLEHIAQISGINKSSLKNTIYRLKLKEAIKEFESKQGRGGWVRYEINQSLFSDILHQDGLLDYKIQQQIMVHKGSTEWHTEKDTNTLSSSSNLINTNTTTTTEDSLPYEWSAIDLVMLKDAFKATGLNNQFFGISQLKSIFNSKQNQLSATDVQNAINQFAYGILHFSNEEPYNKMKNPAAILFESLRTGDGWYELRYLDEYERKLFNVYKNISIKLENEKKTYFNEWLNNNKQKKYEYYKSKLPSTHYYSDKEFYDLALKDYYENLWIKEKIKLLKEFLGVEFGDLIDKFVKLD